MMNELAAFERFNGIMDRLLGEGGCPWDKEQTLFSLRQYLLEESYEAVDAVNNGDMPALCEELGDVFLEAVFMAKVAEKGGFFTLEDVLAGISDKMVSRHTHIFGADVCLTAEDVMKNWEIVKKLEKRVQSAREDMESVPKALPALVRASKVLKRSGEEAAPTEELAGKIKSNLDILLGKEPGEPGMDAAMGGLLLDLAALSRHLGVNQEFSLTNAIEKFINRFESGGESPK